MELGCDRYKIVVFRRCVDCGCSTLPPTRIDKFNAWMWNNITWRFKILTRRQKKVAKMIFSVWRHKGLVGDKLSQVQMILDTEINWCEL